MRVLLDTHAFLWFVSGDASLSARARTVIEAPSNEVLVSVASAWELAIKVSIGKLTLDAPSVEDFFREQLLRNSFGYLPIEPKHVFRIAALPFHHRDPFDRLLVAQALEETIPIVSSDAVFARYGVTLIW